MDLKWYWVISKWAHCCWQRLRSRRAKKRRKREDKSDSSQINIPDISPPCLQSVNHRWISSDSCEIVERWCGAISQFCGFLKGRLIFSAKCFQHSGSVEVNSIKHSITLSQNSSSQVFSSNSSEHPSLYCQNMFPRLKIAIARLNPTPRFEIIFMFQSGMLASAQVFRFLRVETRFVNCWTKKILLETNGMFIAWKIYRNKFEDFSRFFVFRINSFR